MRDFSPTPTISVLMPVYNGERFLSEAITSILTQTFTDFEFIIIDDGSTDGTGSILDFYSDPRIVRITHPRNLGIAPSLNDGIGQAKGDFIARMDADDISLPERFEKQIQFLGDHPEIGVLGGYVQQIDKQGIRFKIIKRPITNGLIKWRMCFKNPIFHPTAMVRSNILRQINGYRDLKASEDYDLWQRMSEKTQLANLDQIILFYRIHGKNISTLPNENRKNERNGIRKRAIKTILGTQKKFDWDSYWNDNYYAVILIFNVYYKLSRNMNISERKIMADEASRYILKKAKLMKLSQYLQKCIAYMVVIYLKPELIFKIRRTISQNLWRKYYSFIIHKE